MPITPNLSESNELVLTFDGLSRGLDSHSEPTKTDENHLPAGLQNANVSGGYYSTIAGSTLHKTDFVMPDAADPKDLAYYIPSSGDPVYLAYCQDGNVYKWTGSAWVTVRTGLSSTAGVYATHTQIGDYLIFGNGVDANQKYDGTGMIPLGAKRICGFEDWETWTGGTVNTTLVKEGVQSRSVTSTGANADMSITGTWNNTSPLLLAEDYTTSDYIDFWVHFDSVTGLDTTNTVVYFGTTSNYSSSFYLQAVNWGTLAVGWNKVHVLKSAFASVGTPDWSTIVAVLFRVDTTGSTITMTVDDCYMIYANVMPPVQFVSNWKNMVIGAEWSNVHFTPVSAIDEYDPSGYIPVDENDGTDVAGLFPYYDLFLVFKDNATYTLSVRLSGIAYPDYVFGLKRVTSEHGVSSHRAIVEAGGKVFIPWRGNIYQFEGFGTTKISYRIDPTLQDFAPLYLHNMQGLAYRAANTVYWWWTPADETTNITGIMYDYQEKAFLPYDGDAVAVALSVFEDGVEYPLTADYSGNILAQSSGTTFNGTDIDTVIPFPWVSAGPPHATVSWRELSVPYETGTGDMIVQYRIANHPREFSTASWSTAGTIDLSVTGEYGRVYIGERSRWLQIRLTSSDGSFITPYWPMTLKGRVLGYLL